MESINLLTRRGFLIDSKNDRYYLSDNSDPSDREYLNQILHSSKIGYVDKDGYISITSNEDAAQAELQKLFLPIKKGIVGVGSCCYTTSWSYPYLHAASTLAVAVTETISTQIFYTLNSAIPT